MFNYATEYARRLRLQERQQEIVRLREEENNYILGEIKKSLRDSAEAKEKLQSVSQNSSSLFKSEATRRDSPDEKLVTLSLCDKDLSLRIHLENKGSELSFNIINNSKVKHIVYPNCKR